MVSSQTSIGHALSYDAIGFVEARLQVNNKIILNLALPTVCYMLDCISHSYQLLDRKLFIVCFLWGGALPKLPYRRATKEKFLLHFFCQLDAKTLNVSHLTLLRHFVSAKTILSESMIVLVFYKKQTFCFQPGCLLIYCQII